MINSVTSTQTAQGLPAGCKACHAVLGYTCRCPPEACGLPTPTLTELTDAQRYCVQSIYIDFHPNRLINVGGILRNLFMPLRKVWLLLRPFARNLNLLDVSWNSYTNLVFKLSPCFNCNMFLFGQFPGVWFLISDVSELLIGSIFTGPLPIGCHFRLPPPIQPTQQVYVVC